MKKKFELLTVLLAMIASVHGNYCESECSCYSLIIWILTLLYFNFSIFNFKDNSVKCYECESPHEPYCLDPLNQTNSHGHKISLTKCNGCCVKIVYNENSREYQPYSAKIQETFDYDK